MIRAMAIPVASLFVTARTEQCFLDEMVTSWILSGKDYDLAQLAAPVVDLFLRGAAVPVTVGRPARPRRVTASVGGPQRL